MSFSRFCALRPRPRPQPQQSRRRQRGMALIEALVSILIFSFGVLGLVGLEARAINFAGDAEDRNRAALFASEIASTMWLTGTVTQPGATIAAWQASVADPTQTGVSNGILTVIPVAGKTNAAGVINAADITITWQPPSDGTTITAATRSVLTTRVILP